MTLNGTVWHRWYPNGDGTFTAERVDDHAALWRDVALLPAVEARAWARDREHDLRVAAMRRAGLTGPRAPGLG